MNEKQKVAPERLWSFGYIVVALLTTLSAFSFYTNQTILSKYLTGDLQLPISTAGTIVGLFSLTSLFCRPICGVMTDWLNKKMLLLISNLMMTTGLIGFAYVQNVPTLFFMRILNGVGFAISSTVHVALSTSFIPKSRMAEGIGYMGLSMVLGSAVAPGLGLWIAEQFSMRAVFQFSALMPIVGCMLLFTFHDRTKSKEEKQRVLLSDIVELKALGFSLCGGIFSFINGIINAYIVLFSELRGVGSISLYFTLYAICLFVIRPLSGKLTDSKGLRFTVVPAMLLTAVAMIILCNSASLSAILISGVLRAIGQGAAQPSLQAGCITFIGKERSGVATSTYYLCGDIGQGTAPMLGGVILTYITGVSGYQTLFYMCAAMLVLGCVYFSVFAKKRGIH